MTVPENIGGYNLISTSRELQYVDTVFSRLDWDVFDYIKQTYNSCDVLLLQFFYFGNLDRITSNADIRLKFTSAESSGFQLVIGGLSEWFTNSNTSVGYRFYMYDRSVKLLVDGKESQNAESVGLNADTVMGFICPNSIAFRYPGSEQMDSLFKHVDVSYH